MRFSQIPGLHETKEQLINAVKTNHVAHALLFDGASGSAALPMALAFSAYVNCENPTENDSCGACPSHQTMAGLCEGESLCRSF